jgi:hypothetical protein
MKNNSNYWKALLGTFLSFAALTGLAGAVVYFVPTLLDTWMGPAILGAPPAIGIIFSVALRSWMKPAPAAKKARVHEEETAEEETIADEETPRPVAQPKAAPGAGKKGASMPAVETVPAAPDPEVVIVQVLGLLQREGRLIDFIQEDIEPYDDAQIGAAVRDVHRGCRAALKDAFGLAPVLSAAEGSEVEVEEDFDPTKIKLIGNVHGKPPFTGVLRHSGWRFTEIRLPQWNATEKTDVLAPAEVEIL